MLVAFHFRPAILFLACSFLECGYLHAADQIESTLATLNKITSIESEWKVETPIFGGQKDAKPRVTNCHSWVSGEKFRLEVVVPDENGKAKSRTLSVYDGTTLYVLRLPQKTLAKRTGKKSAVLLNYQQLIPQLWPITRLAFITPQTPEVPLTVNDAKVFLQGIIEHKWPAITAKNGTLEGKGIDPLADKDSGSVADPITIQLSFLKGWPVSATTVPDKKLGGITSVTTCAEFTSEPLASSTDSISLPRKITREMHGDQMPPGGFTVTYQITRVAINEPIDDGEFEIDISMVEPENIMDFDKTIKVDPIKESDK